jgi:hypothetical protein
VLPLRQQSHPLSNGHFQQIGEHFSQRSLCNKND